LDFKRRDFWKSTGEKKYGKKIKKKVRENKNIKIRKSTGIKVQRKKYGKNYRKKVLGKIVRRKVTWLPVTSLQVTWLTSLPVTSLPVSTHRSSENDNWAVPIYYLPSCSTEIRKESYFPRTIRDWNALSDNCVTIGSLETFKAHLQDLF
jgi:hypothetical protein